MTFKTAQRILRVLQAHESTPAVRVAVRWLKANLDTQYDIMLRLQVLEGAAGFPEHSNRWWQNGQASLKKAQAHFEHDAVKPEWFSSGNTGMISVLRASVLKAIHQFKVYLDPYEVINNALMGLPSTVDLDVIERTQQIPLAVGKKLTTGILSGKETPGMVAEGVLAKALWNKVSTEAKKNKAQLLENEEGAVQDIPDVPSPPSAEEILQEIIFEDMDDPLGKKIRQFMRNVWDASGQKYAKVMGAWLDVVEHGRIPLKKEITFLTGVSPQSFAQKHWEPAWRRFNDALWKNYPLQRELAERYEQRGAEWSQRKPNIDILVPAHKYAVETLIPRHIRAAMLPWFREEYWGN